MERLFKLRSPYPRLFAVCIGWGWGPF